MNHNHFLEVPFPYQRCIWRSQKDLLLFSNTTRSKVLHSEYAMYASITANKSISQGVASSSVMVLDNFDPLFNPLLSLLRLSQNVIQDLTVKCNLFLPQKPCGLMNEKRWQSGTFLCACSLCCPSKLPRNIKLCPLDSSAELGVKTCHPISIRLM